MADATYDVILVGAGHNALTCAAYLAEAGLDVAVDLGLLARAAVVDAVLRVAVDGLPLPANVHKHVMRHVRDLIVRI